MLRFLFLYSSLHHKFIQSLCWCMPISPPDQVRDAGRILREWHSRGKRQICTVITVMTPLVTHWHLVIAWPRYIETFFLNLSVFQSFAFILTHISLFLSCNHSDTCLTPHSLVAETYRHSTYSPLRVIYHTLVLSFTLNPALVWLIHIFCENSSLSSNVRGRFWNSFTKVFPPSGGQRHSKHPDWRRER